VTLVLTGAAGPAEVAGLQRSARADLSGRVRRTGRIPRDDVEGLIAHAAVLAFPSRYEGFGLPVLEAMVRGTPVVAAATTALPEVVGDAGILLPPDDVAAWREGLRSVLDDPAERDRLVEAGHARAARFTWAKTATGLIDAHRVALG
jgi:alpha-1,3-rhamnosyl/mannosyltransferase